MNSYSIQKTKEKLTFFKMIKVKPNFSQIARDHNVDRHTVSKLYKGKEVKVKRDKPSTPDYLRDEIRDLLKDPAISITAAYFYFKVEERGENAIKCTLSNFLKYVKKYNLNEKEKDYIAHVRYETDPGVQLQFDWVEDLKLKTIDGETIEFNLFSATLGYSRMHYFEFSYGKTESDAKRCLLHSFEYFGGVTQKALTDNMSAIVSVRGTEKQIHKSVIQFFKDLDCKLILCKPKTPETKGKCESSNKFAQWLYAYDGKLKDRSDLHRVIKRLNIEINKRPNETTGVPPLQLFEKEKGTLKLINKRIFEDWNQQNISTQRVPATCLIYYKKNYYSVHPKYIGKRVSVEGIEDNIYVYYNKVLIASHKRTENKLNCKDNDYYQGLASTGLSEDLVEQYSSENLKRLKK